MAGHHIVPRFHLARWANPAGLIEVYDCRELEVREQDPKQFYTLPAFNRMEGADGKDDPWLEHQFLGTLDSDAARIMRQLENAARPRAQVQRIKKRGGIPAMSCRQSRACALRCTSRHKWFEVPHGAMR